MLEVARQGGRAWRFRLVGIELGEALPILVLETVEAA